MNAQPNIVYIHTHDTGRFLSPYGYSLPTPNLHAFSRRATVFRNAHCAGPTCSPSRAALLTGMSPHSAGMLGLAHRGFGMSDYSRHLANHLRSHGYTTALAGVQHEVNVDRRQLLGYTEFLSDQPAPPLSPDLVPGGRHWSDEFAHPADRDNALRAADWLSKRAASIDGNGPFFLSFGMVATHRAYPAFPGASPDRHPFSDDFPEPDRVALPAGIADTPANRVDFAEYALSAATADRCAGIVLDTLERTGLAANTIVLYTTDHGIAFPGYKCTLRDTGTGVALMLAWPDNPRAGEVVDSLVSQVDLFPTLCDLAGIETPDHVEGVSLLPVFRGEVDEVREELFSEVSYHAGYEPKRAIRTQRYKLIRHWDPDTRPVAVNIDDSAPKELLREIGWLERPVMRDALYDLLADPAEGVNLIDDPGFSAIRDDLSKRLDAWMRRTGDPLLSGAVAQPVGARINRRDGYSPTEPTE